ncbi:hypothetical protein [Embleya sp. NPDC001921]
MAGSGRTHVLAAVRTLNRAEPVGETLRCALEALAKKDEVWLAGVVTSEWAERYGRSVRHDWLPKGKPALDARTLQVGEDGMAVLNAVHDRASPTRLRDLDAVRVLRRVWVRQYWYDADGRLRWRGAKQTKGPGARDSGGVRFVCGWWCGLGRCGLGENVSGLFGWARWGAGLGVSRFRWESPGVLHIPLCV